MLVIVITVNASPLNQVVDCFQIKCLICSKNSLEDFVRPTKNEKEKIAITREITKKKRDNNDKTNN